VPVPAATRPACRVARLVAFAGRVGVRGSEAAPSVVPAVAALMIDPALAALRNDPKLAADITEAKLDAEPTPNTEATDPIEPIDAKLPTEAMLRAEPRLAMLSTEFSDAIDHFDGIPATYTVRRVRTEICELLGIDIPLLAFSHCRDVVAAVTNAGGFGVLGASSHTPEQLEHELAWIDEEVRGRPYGLDVIVPATFEGKGLHLDAAAIQALVPQEQKDFVKQILTERGVDVSDEQLAEMDLALVGDDVGERLMDVAFKHPIKLIANALGVPPPSMIERARQAGIPVAALVGAKEHAVKQVEAGVDVIVAQGTEAGGHCGEVTTMVLVPEVIEAIGNRVPVLAAGGIVTGRQMAAAVAMGAAGAWTGSVWLTTEEAETAAHTKAKMLAATSRDTVRSRGRTGKPSRQLRSAWTEAWDGAGTPLPMPLQTLISEPALRRVDVLADRGEPGAQELATYWVGQGVGLMNKVKPTRQVVLEMAEDYLAAAERLAGTLE
jgi:NAD(P)H-dependent flavin oxidoreductase YrpB (nitropropane dioxygenase family)